MTWSSHFLHDFLHHGEGICFFSPLSFHGWSFTHSSSTVSSQRGWGLDTSALKHILFTFNFFTFQHHFCRLTGVFGIVVLSSDPTSVSCGLSPIQVTLKSNILTSSEFVTSPPLWSAADMRCFCRNTLVQFSPNMVLRTRYKVHFCGLLFHSSRLFLFCFFSELVLWTSVAHQCSF